MFNEKASSADMAAASVETNRGVLNQVDAGGVYAIECYDAAGNLKWREETHNLVVNVGLQDMNAQYLKGSSYTAACPCRWAKGRTGEQSSHPCRAETPASRPC